MPERPLVTADPSTLLQDYQLRLPSFEGPLDVLLRLVERSQLAITDVSLVAVTDQFLDHVRGLVAVAPEAIADFAAVAGRLVLLKSRSLLPRPATTEDDDETNDLVKQLVEYQTVREAARLLGTWDASGRGAFAPLSGVIGAPADSAPVKLALHPSSTLARALRRRLSAVPRPSELVAVRPMVTLRDMIERVLTAVRAPGVARFSSIRAACQDRHEVLTAFLAVLVLVRRRAIEAEQTEVFGDITLLRVETMESTMVNDAADD